MWAVTRLPSQSAATPAPRDSTVPAISRPGTVGRAGSSGSGPLMPARIAVSRRCTPAAAVDGAGTAVRDGRAAPGQPPAPAREAQVEEVLGAGHAVRLRLVGADRELPLEELLARRGEGAVVGGRTFDPAGPVQVGEDE